MSVDGFSISSLGLPKEVTSAQATANAEHLAQTGNEKVVGKIDRALNKKINNDEEKEHKNEYFEDGFKNSEEDDGEKDEKDKQENKDGTGESLDPENSVGYRPPLIKDPENIVVRYNSKNEKVELFNKVTKKTIESIKTEEFVEMINKLDYNSGVLVNRKI